MWLCVVQFSNSQRNPRAANRSRSFHSDLPRSGAGARSAANPHAACDAAGTGNGTTAPPTRARRGKPWIQTRSGLRVTAPVPDPTDLDQVGEHEQISHTKRGSPGGHDHKRILRDHVGPTGRDLPQPACVVVKIDAMASPAVAVRDEFVLSSE